MAAALVAVGPLAADELETVSYVGLTAGPASASDCRNLENDWPSPFTNALAWSDGQLPHKGATYIAGQIDGKDSLLWTPIQRNDTTYDMFDTLVLDGCTLCIRHAYNRAAIFNDLRVSRNSAIWVSDTDSIIGGKLTVGNGALLSLAASNNRHFRVDSDLSGNGDIRCNSQSGTNARKAGFSLLGVNTDFSGKVMVTTGFAAADLTFDKCSTLTITNAFGLGGTLSGELSETYDALHLQKMSVLNVGSRDLTLPADSNRGLLVGLYGGRINVPEEAGTFTMNWPVTLTKSVHFYKEGDGHLVLGNTLHFLNKNGTFISSTAAGTDCEYFIDIRGGTVSVTDSHAMDGAYIAFSNETAFVMSVDLSEGDLKTYGLRCDKTRYGTPLATTMPIRLCAANGGKLTEGRYLVSLITVKSTYAADVAEKLSIEELPAHYRLLGITSAAAEGVSNAVTFKAEIVRRGMTVSLR